MANLVLSLAFLFLAFGKVQCRFLRLNSSVLVSDGVANVDHRSPFLSLNGPLSSSAEAFHLLTFLSTLAVAGLTENEEDAQAGVSVSVGVCAGSTVFCLTLQWGICVIFGRNSFKPESSTSRDSEHSTSRTSLMKEKLSLLTGLFTIFVILSQSHMNIDLIFPILADSGVTTDNKTGYTAGIMLLSLIPLLLFLIHGFRKEVSSNEIRESAGRVFESCAEAYTRKARHKRRAPNVPVIRSLFAKVDRDGDQTLSISEVEALIADIKSGKVDVEKEYAIAEVLKTFDLNKDGTITEGEFVEGFKKWIHEAKQLAEDGSSHSRKSLRQAKNSMQVVQPWIEERRHELVKIERLMSRILKHVHSQAFEAGGLLTDDGSPNVDRIKSIFEEFDSNHNKLISQSELKEVIQNIRFGKFQLDHDLVAENVMKDFDEDGDQMISEQEFINGFTKWIHKATHIANSKDSKNFIDEFDKIAWKEVDSLYLWRGGHEQHNGLSILLAIVYIKGLTWDYSVEVL
ncbi:hypothetical protein C3L33_06176, partial [Rhododendron williamsianum]